MHPFLEALADKILLGKASLRDHIVVLPTKRAGNFFSSILGEKLESPTWLPEILTPNELATRISGLEPAERLLQTFTLYEAYKEQLKGEAYSLSDFMSWSDIMLSDFNDVDAYMLDPSAVFKELADYTELEHFSFLDKELSDKQRAFRAFWQSLSNVFQSFRKRLESMGIGTTGMIVQKASERVQAFLENNPDLHFTIAGFSALSESELRLYGAIEKSGCGKVYYDLDPTYQSDFTNAAYFIRKNVKRGVGEVLTPETPFSDQASEVQAISTVSKLDQANAVAALLSDQPDEITEETCVVLADESMLLPIIERLPERIKHVNVTMGIRLREFLFFNWLELWFELHRFAIREEGKVYFLADRVNRLAEHPFTKILGLSLESDGKQNLIGSDSFKGSVLSKTIFRGFDEKPWEKGKSLMDVFEQVLEELYKEDQEFPEIQAAVFGFEKLIEMGRHLSKFPYAKELNWTQWHKMCRHILNTSKLSLIGEQVRGLQIMGVLETRALGFEHLILVSADEGNFPKTTHSESFIPFEIRQFHRLPGKREKEAVYAYQFYRLLSHSSRFRAIYHTDSGTFSGGEMSRYLRQIENESKSWENCRFDRISLIPAVSTAESMDKSLVKTEKVLKLIKDRLTSKGLSASSINRYNDSPLEWYYEYILELREPQKEAIDHAVFGSIVHRALENLYSPFEGQELTAEALKKTKASQSSVIKAAFEEYAPDQDLIYGMNRIHLETAEKMISSFIEEQISDVNSGVSIRFLKAEKEVCRNLEVEVNGESLSIPINGFIDRIEERDGKTRLIDFKTGKVSSTDISLSINENEPGIERYQEKLRNKPKGLQLLLYEWLMQDKPIQGEIVSQIICLSRPGDDSLTLKRHFADSRDFELMEEFLAATVQEMLNPEIPIESSEDFEYAKFI